MNMKKTIKNNFNEKDEEILSSLKNVVEGIAILFGNNCEVVLHSFKNIEHPEIIAIKNGYISGRKVGDCFSKDNRKYIDEILKLKKDVYGSYAAVVNNGRLTKSVTILIRNNSSKIIGVLCINFDLSISLNDFLESFMGFVHSYKARKEVKVFPRSAKRLVENALEESFEKISKLRGISPYKKNELILEALYGKGIFEIRNAIEMVSRELGLSKSTVYNYVRKFKKLSNVN